MIRFKTRDSEFDRRRFLQFTWQGVGPAWRWP